MRGDLVAPDQPHDGFVQKSPYLRNQKTLRNEQFLASRKGFEPLTYGLGNRCSILLSYREIEASSAATERAIGT